MADYLLSNAAIESLRAWMQTQYGDAFLAENSILGVDAELPAGRVGLRRRQLRLVQRLPDSHRDR